MKYKSRKKEYRNSILDVVAKDKNVKKDKKEKMILEFIDVFLTEIKATLTKCCIHCSNKTSLREEIAAKLNKIIEEIKNLKIIIPTVEPPPNKLSQNQIFASGQMNMLLRVTEIIEKYS